MLLAEVQQLVDGWCDAIEELLARVGNEESGAGAVAAGAGSGAGAAAAVAAALAAATADGRAGPHTEREFWEMRTNHLQSVIEQQRSRDCKVMIGVLSAAKDRVMRRWNPIHRALVDATSEAKDNLKYLRTFERQAQVLYTGTPGEMADAVPGIIGQVKLLHAVTRHYASSERTTALFSLCTNQMVNRCRDYVESPVDLWSQSPTKVQAKLRECVALHQTYQAHFEAARDKERAAITTSTEANMASTARSLDVNETVAFGKMDSFCRRAEKVIELFMTIEQVPPAGRAPHLPQRAAPRSHVPAARQRRAVRAAPRAPNRGPRPP